MATESLSVRQLVISPPLLLAPMAGLTHSAFRTLLMSFGGVGLLSTEMLSARRLPSENSSISPYLIRSGFERPLSYQLFVTNVGDVERAVDKLHEFGADAVDINLGCPAPRVRQAGGGSSLMQQNSTIRAIVRTARESTELPLTAKIRLGERLDMEKLRDFCLMLEGEGIDLLTVHARLRGEGFCRPPRWEWIGHVKSWLSIPVIANGSVFSVENARACLQTSGADGLMIGRAAPQQPWIFAHIARRVYGHNIPPKEINLPEIFMHVVQELVNRFRSERQLGRLKEFTHYFSANYTFGHHLASAVQSSSSVQEAVTRAGAFFEKNDNQNKPDI